MPRTVDFDAIREQPVEVKLDGKWYKLPSDIPIELYAEIQGRDEGDDADIVLALRDQVLALLQIHQPKLKALPCGVKEVFEIIPTVYGVVFDEYNTSKFTGWPTASSPYESGSPNTPTNEVVILRLRPIS